MYVHLNFEYILVLFLQIIAEKQTKSSQFVFVFKKKLNYAS